MLKSSFMIEFGEEKEGYELNLKVINYELEQREDQHS